MKNKQLLTSALLLFVSLIQSKFISSSDDLFEDDEFNEENLLTKLDCKPGQQTDYVIALQSSLLEKFHDANLLIKTKFSIRCLSKQFWTNFTSEKTYPALLYEAKIESVIPIHANSGAIPNLKTGKLQISSLFDALEKTPSSGSASDNTNDSNIKRDKHTNIKVGTVSKFFENFASSFSDLMIELFRRLVKMFEHLIQRKKDNPSEKTSPVSLTCKAKSSSKYESRRFVRSATMATDYFSQINSNDYRSHLNELYRLPWTFLQLEEGTVVEVKLSPLESMSDVKNFKKFISSAFSTQLNERNKERIEKSSLGMHKSHYEIEYEMTNKKAEAILKNKQRLRRATYPLPVVSIVRSVSSKDILQPSSFERNHLRHRKLYLEDLNFTSQQVQLVEGNSLVASGGHFRSVMKNLLEIPNHSKNNKRNRRSLKNGYESITNFDDNLRQAMIINLEYSMVKVDKMNNNNNDNKYKRSRREAVSDDIENDSMMIYYTKKMNDLINRTKIKEQPIQMKHLKINQRYKRNYNSDIICHSLNESQLIEHIRFLKREELLNLIEDENKDAKQCFENKEFGTRFFKAYFNRTVTSKGYSKNSNDFQKRMHEKEYFHTDFRIGAQFMGEDVTVGHFNLASHNNRSQLSLNLFGSEYIDLDLCEIRNKTFSQANLVPLFNENIWFMTNVGIKIKYDFDFHINVPEEVCNTPKNLNDATNFQDASSSNAKIISKISASNSVLAMMHKSRLNLAAALDASFLIFNAEMHINSHFDMNSDVNFGPKCLTAHSNVQPINVSMNFNYKFFHPVCNEWMEDNWQPKQLNWELTQKYRSSWFDSSCST